MSWQCRALTLLSIVCSVCAQLQAGVPITVSLASGATQTYQFTSCSGSEGLSIKLTPVFGNADLYVWNQPVLSQSASYTAIKTHGVDSVSIPPLLGIREYTIRVDNPAFYTATAQLLVEYAPTALTLGKQFRPLNNDGCAQYFSVDVTDLTFKELVVSVAHSTNATWPFDVWMSQSMITPSAITHNTSLADNTTSFNAVVAQSSTLSVGKWYITTRLRQPVYAPQFSHCSTVFGATSAAVGTTCTSDAMCVGLSCVPKQYCYAAANGGGLIDASCESSHNCQDSAYLLPAKFRCDTASAQCQYEGSAGWATIEGWTGLQCQATSDCNALHSTFVCGGPWMDIQADTVQYGVLHGPAQLLVAKSNEASTLLLPNCVPGATVDLRVDSQTPSSGKLLATQHRLLSDALESASYCAGNDCYCVANETHRLFGTQCQSHSDCTSLAASKFTCSGSTGKCEFASSTLGSRQIGIVGLSCATAADCQSPKTPTACKGVPQCRFGPTFGGGYLPGAGCTADLDCWTLREDQFRCNGASHAGTDNYCEFSADWDSDASPGTWVPIPNMTTGCGDNGNGERQWCLRPRNIGELYCEGATDTVATFDIAQLQALQTTARVANISATNVQSKKEFEYDEPNTCVSKASKFYSHQSTTCDDLVGLNPLKTGTCTAGAYGGALALETCATDDDCYNIPDARFVCATTNPPSLIKVPLGYCQLLVQETGHVAAPYQRAIEIPHWNRALMPCTVDANCSSLAVKQARRCEPKACRVGAQFGGGRLLGTACNSSADCQSLDMNKFRCMCDGIEGKYCNDPKSGIGECAGSCSGAANMRCAYVPTGESARAYPIPGWNVGVLACKKDADCQTPFVLNSLRCEASVSFKPATATNTTYVHLWQPNLTASTRLNVTASFGSNRDLLMDQFGVYNQTQFSPVCTTTPYTVERSGDSIQMQGINLPGLRKDIEALGPYFDTEGNPGNTHPERNAFKEQLQCVFRRNGTLRQCHTTGGDPIPGTPCTVDDQCRPWKIDTSTGAAIGLHSSQFVCNARRSGALGCSIAVGAWPAVTAHTTTGQAWAHYLARGPFKMYPFASSTVCTVDTDCYALIDSNSICPNATATYLRTNATLLPDGHTVECAVPAAPVGLPSLTETVLAYVELEALMYDSATGTYSSFLPVPHVARAYSGAPVTYYESNQVITSMIPPMGPVSGGTSVTVTATNLVALQNPTANNRDSIFRSTWAVPEVRLGEMAVRVDWAAGDHTILPANLQTSTTAQFTTPAQSAGIQQVQLSMNGVGYLNTSLIFRTIPNVVLTGINPPSGPMAGGTAVTITGSGFTFQEVPGLVPPHLIRCKFGDSASVIPTTITPTELVCVSPRLGTTAAPNSCETPGQSQVSAVKVTLNDQHFQTLPSYPSEVGAQFVYTPRACNLTTLQPPQGPEDGGIKINVKGAFYPDLSISQLHTVANRSAPFTTCRFAGVTGLGRFVNTSFVQCTLPRLATRLTANQILTATVEVALNGQQFVASNDTFSYFSTNISVGDMSVKAGPLTGGTVTTVRGKGFFNASNNILCKFGDTVSAVKGVFLQSNCTLNNASLVCSSVQCVSPVIAGYSNVFVAQVRISFDGGQSYTVSSTPFVAYPAFTATSITPSIGVFDTNTSVTIQGTGFQQTSSLQLMLQPACIDIVTTGQCQDPAELAFCTSSQYTVGTNCALSCGQCDGQTVYTSADFVSTTQIVATIPPLNTSHPYYSRVAAGEVHMAPVQISLNSQQFASGSTSSSNLKFAYAARPVIDTSTGLLPSTGPAAGGTIVTVTGSNLLDLSSITSTSPRCNFFGNGTSLPAAIARLGSTTSEAPTTAGGTIPRKPYICDVPSWISTVEENPPELDFSVSWNNLQWSVPKTFAYFRVPIEVTKILPSSGPISGGTVVTFTGRNFTNTGEITCRFGFSRTGYFTAPNLVVETTTSSPVAFVSDQSLTCTSPDVSTEFDWDLQKTVSITAKQVDLQLSLNGQMWLPGLQYDFSPPLATVQATNIAPSSGPVPGVETFLQIWGTNFRDTGVFACRLVKSGNVEVRRSIGKFVNSTYATCSAPALTLAEYLPDSVALQELSLQVSLNNLDFSLAPATGGATFRYYQEPTLTKLSPLNGPATGGTTISIGGDNLEVNVDVSLPVCRFNRDDATKVAATKLPGAALSRVHAYTCVTPSLGVIGSTIIEVALNGQDYVALDSSITFTAMPAGYLTAISPGEGIWEEQITLTISGVGFVTGLGTAKCRFEDAAGTSSTVTYLETTATVVDLQTLTCMTPVVSASPSSNGRFSAVQVTFNDQNYISSPVVELKVNPTPICETCMNAGSRGFHSSAVWTLILCALPVVLFLSLDQIADGFV